MSRIENVFTIVKRAVSAREIAERYGMQYGRNRLFYCPFHDDGTSSMKIDDRFYCFGCGATGDAIDLVSKLFNLNLKEAALKIEKDFLIDKHTPVQIFRHTKKEEERWLTKATRVLCDYLRLLENWKETYEPKITDKEWHPLFCEALLKIDRVEHILDDIMESEPDEHQALYKCYGKEVRQIEERLEQFNRRTVADDIGGETSAASEIERNDGPM